MKCLLRKLRKTQPEDITPANTPTHQYTPGPGAPEGWVEKALYVTGQFEGCGYGQISGNFDGQGMSCGILQWCVGQGSLQEKIIKPFMAKYNSSAIRDLQFDTLLKLNTKDAVAMSAQLVKNRDYRRKARLLMETPEMKEIQNEAAQELGSKAYKLASISFAGLREEYIFIAFLWFFDILVQNGSLRGVDMPDNDEVARVMPTILRQCGINRGTWAAMVKSPEPYFRLCDTLLVWTVKRARKCHKKWIDDVISRKGTIAMGEGRVHGEYFRNIHDLYEKDWRSLW